MTDARPFRILSFFKEWSYSDFSLFLIRIYDEKVAEMPLIGTRMQYRRQGMCRIVVNELENVVASKPIYNKLACYLMPCCCLLSIWPHWFFCLLISLHFLMLYYYFYFFPVAFFLGGGTACPTSSSSASRHMDKFLWI